MVIPPDDLEFKVLRIYERLRIPMGGKLAHSMLVKEWAKSRLRYEDLTGAVKRLTCRDALKEERTPEEEALQLTQLGFTRVMELRHHQFRNWLKQLRINFLLALMRNNHTLTSHRRNI